MQVSPRDAPPRHIREGEVMTRCSADHHPAKAKPLLMALKPTDGNGRSQRGQLERASWTQVRDIDNVSVVKAPQVLSEKLIELNYAFPCFGFRMDERDQPPWFLAQTVSSCSAQRLDHKRK